MATPNKSIASITLADGTGGLASNYQLPALNNTNAPVTITAATLTPTISNTGVTKVYDASTSAPSGFTPTYTYSGLVDGDSGAALSNSGAAYNNANVLQADRVTVSGLSITGVTGNKGSLASDYVLSATSKDVAATITPKTVSLAATKVYDGTTTLTNAQVTIGTGIDNQSLTASGATASDTHVATPNKSIASIEAMDLFGVAT